MTMTAEIARHLAAARASIAYARERKSATGLRVVAPPVVAPEPEVDAA